MVVDLGHITGVSVAIAQLSEGMCHVVFLFEDDRFSPLKLFTLRMVGPGGALKEMVSVALWSLSDR